MSATCDPCLGLGLSRPKHFRCSGGACPCCGTVAPARRQPAKPKLRKAKAVGKRRLRSRLGSRPLLRQAEVMEAARLYAEGLTWREVGARLSRDHSGLARAVARLGDAAPQRPAPPPPVSRPRRPPRSGPPLSDEELVEARRLRAEGLSWRAVGTALGRDHSGLARTAGK